MNNVECMYINTPGQNIGAAILFEAYILTLLSPI